MVQENYRIITEPTAAATMKALLYASIYGAGKRLQHELAVDFASVFHAA